MNTTQLINLLEKDKYSRKFFCGVLPIDHLPIKKIKRPCSFIINTHDSTKQGEHWFAVFVPRKGKIEYFDSYGLKPINYQIYKFFEANDLKYIYNKKHLQSYDSTTCGNYATLFIYFRSRGYSMKDFLKFFTSNKLNNDTFVKILLVKIIKNN